MLEDVGKNPRYLGLAVASKLECTCPLKRLCLTSLALARAALLPRRQQSKHSPAPAHEYSAATQATRALHQLPITGLALTTAVLVTHHQACTQQVKQAGLES